LQLRDYQQAAVDAVYNSWREHRKVLMVLPTGGGKTIAFSKIAENCHNRGERCLILAHRDELCLQAHDKMLKSTGIECSTEKAGQTSLNSPHLVTVGSVQTLSRQKRLDKFSPDHFKVIIQDEAHHILSDSNQRIMDHFSQAYVCGVTATASRGDKKSLGQFFDCLAYEYGLKEAVKDGWLAPITAQTVPVNIDLRGVHTKRGDFDQAELGHAIEPYLSEISDHMVKIVPDRRTLVFLPLIKTSQMFAEMLRAKGFRAEHVDGKSKDRAEKFARFESGETNVLTNSMLATEGLDIPPIDCVVILRPTKSKPLFCQMCGRGSRIHPGKTNLLILDFLYQTERISLVHPASLVAESQEVAERMTEKAAKGGAMNLGELESIANSEVTQERESKLAMMLDLNKHRASRCIDPLAFGLITHDEELQTFEATFAWHKEAATEKQAATLSKLGFDPSNMRKGYASALLSSLMGRMEKKQASAKQLAVLQKFKYTDLDKLSFKEASARIDQLAKNNWQRRDW